jgi:branched-subunit amino acid transport protein
MGDTLWPWLMLVIAGVLPSEIWRVLAVVLSRRLDEGSEWLVWVRAVATCLLAGVVARLLLTPTGALAALPVPGRIGAVVAGVAAYAGSRSIVIGIAAGEVAILAAGWFWG